MHLKRIEIFLMVALSVGLTGCHKTGVKFTDMRTAPTATISNRVATIYLQGAFLGSNTWVEAKSRFEDQTLCLSGYRTSSEPEADHEYVINLPAAVSAESMSIVWIEPDGSRVPIPTTR